MSFYFEPERSIFSHEGFYQDSSDKSNTAEWDMFVRKDCNPSVWWKCRNWSTMETEEEYHCYQEVKAVCDFTPQDIFVLSQAIILSELTHNLMISISICFCKQTWLKPLPCSKRLQAVKSCCKVLHLILYRVPRSASIRVPPFGK